MAYDDRFNQQISLNTCKGPTQGFIWMQLLVVTELAIFSVRAPGFFLFSMPSPYLIMSILFTLVIGGLIACLDPQLGLTGKNLGFIVLFNVVTFIVVDLLKIKFRELIGESPGEIIASDDLIQPPDRTDAQKQMKKNLRYAVHRDSIVSPEDRKPAVEVKGKPAWYAGFFHLGLDLDINGGFVSKNRRKVQATEGAL